MREHHLHTTQLRSKAHEIKAGEKVVLSGTVYTARDAAHKRIAGLIEQDKPLPFPLKDAVIYYAGPTPAPDGLPVGSVGPTTSGRMDPYTPLFLDKGLVCMIGKGERNNAVCSSIIKNGAVYLCAIGGGGALAAQCVKSCEIIAFDDLGCESVKKLEVEDFPLIAAVDCMNGNIFDRTKPGVDRCLFG